MIYIFLRRERRRASGIAQQTRKLAAQPDDLSLIPRNTEWKERADPCKSFSNIHLQAVACTHTCVYTHRHTHACRHAHIQLNTYF